VEVVSEMMCCFKDCCILAVPLKIAARNRRPHVSFAFIIHHEQGTWLRR
jgi:hypothetical protein